MPAKARNLVVGKLYTVIVPFTLLLTFLTLVVLLVLVLCKAATFYNVSPLLLTAVPFLQLHARLDLSRPFPAYMDHQHYSNSVEKIQFWLEASTLDCLPNMGLTNLQLFPLSICKEEMNDSKIFRINKIVMNSETDCRKQKISRFPSCEAEHLHYHNLIFDNCVPYNWF